MNGETHPESQLPPKDVIDPIELLTARYDLLARDETIINTELTSVTRARDEAVLRATEPFNPTIKDLNDRLADIKDQQSLEISRKELEVLLSSSPPLYRAALEILVNNYWSDGIEGFLSELMHKDYRSRQNSLTSLIQETLNGLTSLATRLTDLVEPSPAAIYTLHRYELLDEQAQWEGNDSSTGDFVTELQGYKGFVDKDALQVVYEDYLLPDQFGYAKKPKAIVLKIKDAQDFYKQPNSFLFSNFDSRVDDTGGMTVTILRRRTNDTFNSSGLLAVAWTSDSLTPDKNIRLAIGPAELQAGIELAKSLSLS